MKKIAYTYRNSSGSSTKKMFFEALKFWDYWVASIRAPCYTHLKHINLHAFSSWLAGRPLVREKALARRVRARTTRVCARNRGNQDVSPLIGSSMAYI